MIRNATLADIPRIVELGLLMHEESIFARFNYDGGKVSALIATLIDTTIGIALVAEESGVIQGGFLGCVFPHWFGADLQATDYALFIAPDFRGGMAAPRLIKQYVKQALEKGATQVMLANSTGYEPEKVARLFEATGFRKRGYVYELEC